MTEVIDGVMLGPLHNQCRFEFDVAGPELHVVVSPDLTKRPFRTAERTDALSFAQRYQAELGVHGVTTIVMYWPGGKVGRYAAESDGPRVDSE
jgi:hypothetical protein